MRVGEGVLGGFLWCWWCLRPSGVTGPNLREGWQKMHIWKSRVRGWEELPREHAEGKGQIVGVLLFWGQNGVIREGGITKAAGRKEEEGRVSVQGRGCAL